MLSFVPEIVKLKVVKMTAVGLNLLGDEKSNPLILRDFPLHGLIKCDDGKMCVSIKA